MDESFEKVEFKNCPFCAEKINFNAKKCKHCSSNLDVISYDNSRCADKMVKDCPFCAESISVNAKKCKHCGEVVDVSLRMIEELKQSQKQNNGNIVISNSTTQQTTKSESSSSKVDPFLASLLMKSKKSRTTYILLGIFLGSLGVHNFYAGYIGRGICQLLLSLTVALWLIPLIWSFIEIIVVTHDAKNMEMQ